MTKKILLKVTGMHCVSCAMSIDFDLEDLKGVKTVKTNYAKQETVVEFDEEEVKVEKLLEQVIKTGYKAKVSTN